MNTDIAYEKLTGVNIKEQQTLWDERGKGYFGEYLVFNELMTRLSGKGKILMNIEIPRDDQGNTTEIDLLLIQESGIYCFEMKYYKGDIYCNADEKNWVQFFRTAPNYSFYSPIKQNEGHIRALRRIFDESVPINSFIIFTNEDCVLHYKKERVTHFSYEDAIVCKLDWFRSMFDQVINRPEKKYQYSFIENSFRKLMPYSKIKKNVGTGGKEYDFTEYLNIILNNVRKHKENESAAFEEERRKMYYELKKEKENLKVAKMSFYICAVISLMVEIIRIVM